ITEEEYYDWQTQMNITNVVSLNEFTDQGSEVPVDKTVTSSLAKPEEVIEQNELKLMMKEALETLTERERKVIILYYYEELTLKEVSHILGVSESRVSQLHTKGLQKMKKRLGNYMGILTDNI
ncbi:sigma-70 family RNA polymerase sigma factor, partial [bacterium 1XD42-8]